MGPGKEKEINLEHSIFFFFFFFFCKPPAVTSILALFLSTGDLTHF